MPAHDETPDLANPPVPTAIGRQLARACGELERRLSAGQPCGAEDLLGEFPELARDKNAVLELIYTEFVLREERGERGSDEDWYVRFPQWEADLRALFQVNAHVRGADSAAATLSLLPPGVTTTLAASLAVGSARRVGDYELLEELGRGGMGVVYRARQMTLNREVAFKTILRADVTQATVARFWVEAEVMAAVKHPYVVQVFELGEYADGPFMAMELIAGGSLADRLTATGALPAREAGGLVEKIARGVAAAHELGIVHRDLKPANILLEGRREGGKVDNACASTLPAAPLTPKVSDFGIAKWRSADLTRTLALIGTPAYMAPEQAAGGAKFVGPQADVWALGVILYECVSGKLPFEGDTPEVLLSQIRSAEPVALRTRVRGMPRDLDTIVTKCLTKEPEGRYPTAAELADDLGRFVRGEPILAHPVSPAERLVRWVRRKPTAAAVYGLSALTVLLAVVVLAIAGLWREAEGAKNEADSARGRVEGLLGTEKQLRGDLQSANAKLTTALKGEEEAKQAVERERAKLARYEYAKVIQIAYQLWKENRIEEARRFLADTRPELRGWEYDYVHRLCNADLATLGHAGMVHSASFSPDGLRVVTASEDKTARIWDTKTGRMLAELKGHTQSVHSASFSPDGSKVLTNGEDMTARIWDATTGRTLLELKGHASTVMSASFSADGSRVVTASDDKTARIWDAATGRTLAELKGHTNTIRKASFSPDGSRVVTGSLDSTARIWDAATGRTLAELKGHTGSVLSASFSADGSRVVTTSYDSTARIWDTATGRTFLEFKGHTNPVRSASFSPDGSRVVTGSDDMTGRIWDAASGKTLLELKGHTVALHSASFSRDGSRVVTASHDMTGRIWDAATGKTLLELKGHTHALFSASFSPDGSKVLTNGMDDSARIWDATTGKAFLEIRVRTNAVRSASLRADGLRVVTAKADKTARIMDPTRGKTVVELKGHANFVLSASFSADGSRVVTTSYDMTARVWDAATGRTLAELKGHTGAIHSASFSSDGSRVVTASDDSTARVWDAATGRTLAELKGHTGPIRSASFSSDGSRVVTASYYLNWDKTVRVWDTESGAELLALPGVVFASFSPDSSRLMTSGLGLRTTVFYDSRPVNRSFISNLVAPAPRAVGR